MICRSCVRALSRRGAPIFAARSPPVRMPPVRSISRSTCLRAEPSTAGPTTATSASPRSDGGSGGGGPPPAVTSSVPEGTPLKGLSFVKNQADPLAKADHEYPAWLWRVLEEQQAASGEGADESEGDLFAKSKKQRRKAAKALRKQAALDAQAPRIPRDRQSVDLPAGDGTVEGAKRAAAERNELTRAMRERRRKTIKEDNFLRNMR